jgi:hypothetical protein
VIDQQKAITVLGDDVCRACSKIFGSEIQCPSCRNEWQWQQPIFDYTKFGDLEAETIQALRFLESYRIPDGVISRLVESEPYNRMSREEILVRVTEFKKFMALLVINHKKNRRVEMLSKEVDEIWHTHILFTKEYQDFCKMLVGEYVHHAPNVPVDERDSSPIRNYPIAGTRNFNEDYQKYFGMPHPLWKASDGPEARDLKGKTRKKRIALAVTLSLNAMLVAFLVRELLSAGSTTALIYTAGAFVPVLFGGILWSRLSKDPYNKRMTATVVMVTFVALLGTAVIVTIQCEFDEGTKKATVAGFAVLFSVISLLFAVGREKRFKKQDYSKKGGCGGSVGVGYGSSDGAGAGCGGGGCGGGGC